MGPMHRRFFWMVPAKAVLSISRSILKTHLLNIRIRLIDCGKVQLPTAHCNWGISNSNYLQPFNPVSNFSQPSEVEAHQNPNPHRGLHRHLHQFLASIMFTINKNKYVPLFPKLSAFSTFFKVAPRSRHVSCPRANGKARFRRFLTPRRSRRDWSAV